MSRLLASLLFLLLPLLAQATEPEACHQQRSLEMTLTLQEVGLGMETPVGPALERPVGVEAWCITSERLHLARSGAQSTGPLTYAWLPPLLLALPRVQGLPRALFFPANSALQRIGTVQQLL